MENSASVHTGAARPDQPDIFVIMGALVLPGGLPGDAIQRRVKTAIEASALSPHPLFLPSGGIGRNPPAEATVMRQLLLDRRVSPSSILLEQDSTDTLSSVINCVAILHSLPTYRSVTVCTDSYHMLRSRWLFSLLHIKTSSAVAPSGRSSTGWPRWIFFYLREPLAIVKDTFLLKFMNR